MNDDLKNKLIDVLATDTPEYRSRDQGGVRISRALELLGHEVTRCPVDGCFAFRECEYGSEYVSVPCKFGRGTQLCRELND